MPNHVTNWVEISGMEEAMTKLKEQTYKPSVSNPGIKETPQEPQFDFNGIIKMPEELKETVSPTQVVETQKEADIINKKYLKNSSDWLAGDQKIKAISAAEAKRRIEKYGGIAGRTSEDLVSELLNDGFVIRTGILNWYDWACKHWGTKWGAYNVEKLYISPTKLVLKFDTAWSSPEPIFDKLTEMGFTVNCIWQDEDPTNEGEYGNPYDVFEIHHPQIEVDYNEPTAN